MILNINLLRFSIKSDFTLDASNFKSFSASMLTSPPPLFSFNVFAEEISAFLVGDEILKIFIFSVKPNITTIALT